MGAWMHLPLNHSPVTRDLCASSLIFLSYKRMHLLLEMIAWKSPILKVQSPGGQCVAGGTWGPAPPPPPAYTTGAKANCLKTNRCFFFRLWYLLMLTSSFFTLPFSGQSHHLLTSCPNSRCSLKPSPNFFPTSCLSSSLQGCTVFWVLITVCPRL